MRFPTTGSATVALAVATLALTGCSSASDPAASAPPASGSATGTFPTTVDTKFGEVTVPSEPKRVVALGWGDAETALALGVQPVGASDWLGFGADADGVGPWAQGLYTQKPQIIETLEPSYEAIAALKPDLILDTKGSGDQARHDRLAQIAPTIGVPEGADSYLTDMEDQVDMVAEALGREDQGDALLDAVDQRFDAVAAAHPDWKGKTVTAATKTSEGWGAYVEGSERVAFLEKLGFAQSPKIAAIPANAGGFSVDISSEQLDLLDADAIVAFPIFIDKAVITDDPLWQAVPAVAAGHSIVLDGDVSSAYSIGTTLSTGYALDRLVPLLETATS
ncbi:iron-siderophore ABC transporter substrate-binding protein [Clavibacter tessellarius]|uniref:ABC transporter substrate-binding protein n=1 Tax=Clavibacter tessellarius TaxID=31965 RepID=A0A154V3J2_9MICO|nr:iron-siderophore ABC transporter substrate-binding protein [Clavibacter michiganensis]KZC95724.1 ABC transporter substrate-binding protein [Clavibacter michiganensis subsp. tessellarius]